jgi:hypothetical protein
MGQNTQPSATLADLQSINVKVTTRATNWLDLTTRAWGAEFHAPDHGIYEFSNGRKFDSTDQSQEGLYGGTVHSPIVANSKAYPDMVQGYLLAQPGVRLVTDQTNL